MIGTRAESQSPSGSADRSDGGKRRPARRRCGRGAAALCYGLTLLLSAVSASAAAASDEAPLGVVLGLDWENRAELDDLLEQVANPQSIHFDEFLSAAEFDRRYAPRPETVRIAEDFLRANGLTVVETSASRLLITAVGAATDVQRLIDPPAVGAEAPEKALAAMGITARVLAAGDANEALLRAPSDHVLIPPQTGTPFRPNDVARFYDFQRLYDAGVLGRRARYTTIAIATAFAFSRADLERFWREFGIDRSPSSVELIPVGGPPIEEHAETTLDVEWASAMAPEARVLVYAGIDASTSSFLQVYDRIVNDNRAAVLSTSWGGCERELPSSYLEQTDAIFRRAALQGITVIAASGDSGAFGCADGHPGVAFPASSPYALAVGGTTARHDEIPATETAWEGSGGGTSGAWNAPKWQMEPGEFRGMADVALNADPATPYLTAYEETWWYFGGTSVGAPIWAALVALANQRRADRGRTPLGLAAPALCEIANAYDGAGDAFRDVTEGHNLMYSAGPGWDHPTGWGTPRAYELARALAEWSPPVDSVRGVSQSVVLRATAAQVRGRARLLMRRRCSSTQIKLRLFDVPPGAYTLQLDGRPVASISANARGNALVRVPNADARGCLITINDDAGQALFSGGFGADDERLQIEAAMTNTGAARRASATLFYRSVAGREELTILARALPADVYDVVVGGTAIGALRSHGEEYSAWARFDSEGRGRSFLPLSPRCKSVSVVAHGVAVLRVQASALACQAGGS